MTCSCCAAAGPATARHFSDAHAREELRAFREDGPGTTTRLLLDALATAGARGGTVIDAGSGIGVLAFGLLDAGFSSATCVDLSPAVLAVGVEEAARRGCADRVRWIEGDFAAGADELEPADVVALDRVVCCYPAFAPLLDRATALSRRFIALAYPHDRWYVRAMIALENAMRRFRGDAFRAFVHPVAAMRELLRQRGFRRANSSATLQWRVEVWERQ